MTAAGGFKGPALFQGTGFGAHGVGIDDGNLQYNATGARKHLFTVGRDAFDFPIEKAVIDGAGLKVFSGAANNVAVDVQGVSGQLFSVTDSLTGVVFSVNDISGIPIIEAEAASTNLVTVTGDLRATGEVVAFFSDERLKTKVGDIVDPLSIIKSLNGFKYINNSKANAFGYHDTKIQIGLKAQEVQSVLPEIVNIAPFDSIVDDNGNTVSRTGENYLTLDYSKLIPVLIEAIKDQQKQIDELKLLINKE